MELRVSVSLTRRSSVHRRIPIAAIAFGVSPGAVIGIASTTLESLFALVLAARGGAYASWQSSRRANHQPPVRFRPQQTRPCSDLFEKWTAPTCSSTQRNTKLAAAALDENAKTPLASAHSKANNAGDSKTSQVAALHARIFPLTEPSSLYPQRAVGEATCRL